MNMWTWGYHWDTSDWMQKVCKARLCSVWICADVLLHPHHSRHSWQRLFYWRWWHWEIPTTFLRSPSWYRNSCSHSHDYSQPSARIQQSSPLGPGWHLILCSVPQTCLPVVRNLKDLMSGNIKSVTLDGLCGQLVSNPELNILGPNLYCRVFLSNKPLCINFKSPPIPFCHVKYLGI